MISWTYTLYLENSSGMSEMLPKSMWGWQDMLPSLKPLSPCTSLMFLIGSVDVFLSRLSSVSYAVFS